MGTSFSTIQVKNSTPIIPEQFIKTLSEYFENKNLVFTTADEAEFSCYIAFSEKSNWVTLTSSGYSDGGVSVAHEDAQGLAETLKTHCVVTSVWDSDFIELHLFGNKAKQRDYLWAGRHIADAPKEEGKPEQWESLFSEGVTWEQFLEVLDTNPTFAEEILGDIAPLLGMDSHNIVRDYRIWDYEPNNTNIHILNLKAKDQSSPLFLNEGKTKILLGFVGHPVGGEDDVFSFYNAGGVSTGITVFFVGDCFKEDAEINNVQIERLKDPKKGKSNSKFPDDYEVFTTQAEKKEYDEGKYGYFAYIPDYTFFEGINLNHPSMEGTKRYNRKNDDIIYSYSSVVRYRLTVFSGREHKIRVGVSPDNNLINGQASIIVSGYKSREVYEFFIAKSPSTIPDALRIFFSRLTNQEFLAEIIETDEDDKIRKLAATRLKELQKDEK